MIKKMFKFSGKPLEFTTKPVKITPMQPSNLTNVIVDANQQLPSNPVHLASELTGKTVSYTNKEKSSVVSGKSRVFKIKAVEDITVSKTTGNEYVTVQVQDLDDGGNIKHRNLLVQGIDLVV